MAKRSMSTRKLIAYSLGLVAAGSVAAYISRPKAAAFRAPGILLAAHAELECSGCHRPAPGTLRQQLSANARWLVGLRSTPADLGALDVDTTACLGCHQRAGDRHPVFRFFEPRFSEARAALGAHRCTGCHLEHTGQRVTTGADLCRSCHADLKVAQDPIDTPHSVLAKSERFDTCLGCHDFHGNHRRNTPTRLDQAVSSDEIERYFAGGPSPFGEEKISVAPKEPRL